MEQSITDDTALAGLMAEAGLTGPVSELRALLAGVAAAPPGADPEGWLVLVAPALPPHLARRFKDVRQALASRARPAQPPLTGRLTALRVELVRRGLNGFVVPRADEHQSEYLPARAERLSWLTGFTGSAGVAVILSHRAALFVDGRYTLQAEGEVDQTHYELCALADDRQSAWIVEHLPRNGRLGYDPWLHTAAWVDRMRKVISRHGAELVPVETNPVDAIWATQPPPPLAPVVPHDLAYAGRSAAEKRAELGQALTEAGVQAAVLTGVESICWLLNIRGGDVPRTPLALSFALLDAGGRVDLFIDRRKLTPGLDRHLGEDVKIEAPDALGPALDRLGNGGKTVLADPSSTAAWIFDRLHRAGATVRRGADPCILPKARKNAIELAGSRAAHLRDGTAMCRFLAWLARIAPDGWLTEISAAEHLRSLRAEQDLFRDLSFDTISGFGPNGAIVHYRVSAATNRRLEPGSLYLIDSGAQYLDGTTDITRTVAIGTPTAEMRQRATLVLKGHIALATARFPRGTTGSQLDALARRALWQAGLDFEHGTGHGVGSYLGVHEGPQRISKIGNPVALEPGMILSNEPGYYKSGEYGIRIENLLAVHDCAGLAGGERPTLEFETLTLAPIDRALIDPDLLTAEERVWLDGYHARVWRTIGPRLAGADAAWLEAVTRPLDGTG